MKRERLSWTPAGASTALGLSAVRPSARRGKAHGWGQEAWPQLSHHGPDLGKPLTLLGIISSVS